MLSEFTGTLKKDIRLTQTHINQGYQITKNWNIQKKKKTVFGCHLKEKEQSGKYFVESTLSNIKVITLETIALAFASQWNVSLCECRIGEPSHSNYQSYQLIN